jgi:prepilin-type processing-associated H-X9-DG protein
MPFAPAWAIREGRLHLAGWPQVIEGLFAREGAQPLGGDATFRKLRGHLAARPTMLSYVDSPGMLRLSYPFLLAGGTVLSNLGAAEGVGSVPAWVPSLPALEKYVWPNVSAVSTDADGIVFESYGSIPGGALLGGPSVSPLMVSVLMPALHQARRRAKRAVSMANLRSIGKCIMIYSNDHDDRLPGSLAEMAEQEYLVAGILRSPLSDRPPLRVKNGRLIGEPDYVYLKPPVARFSNLRRPHEIVLAYERPENYRGKGTVVLFADGHVRWLPMPLFQRVLQRSKDLLNRAGGAQDF